MPLLLVLMTACSGGDEEAAQPMLVKPAPPGRQVSQCCSREEAEAAFALVLAGQAQVFDADHAGLQATLETLTPLMSELADTTAVDGFRVAAEALVPCEAEACVEVFAAVADGWASYLYRSRVGETEFAIGWDAKGRHAVFVQGQELASPYGGSRHDLSWGTQAEAEAFQQALREYNAAQGATTPPSP